MTTQQDPATRIHDSGHSGGHSHGGHGWMMIACCIPMLVIAGILVATGAASPGFLVAAVGCTLIMALMMRSMATAITGPELAGLSAVRAMATAGG